MDHTVFTCHPTQVNALRLTPAMQAGTRFTYPGAVVKVEVCSRGAQDEAPKAPRTRRRRRPGGEVWGGGIPLPSRLGSLGERRELPQRGPGRSPGRQRIWCILFVIEPIWWKENSVCLLRTILTQINLQL